MRVGCTGGERRTERQGLAGAGYTAAIRWEGRILGEEERKGRIRYTWEDEEVKSRILGEQEKMGRILGEDEKKSKLLQRG